MANSRGYGALASEYHDNPSDSTLKEVVDTISANIFKINSNATAIERGCKQVGTAKDSEVLREKLHSTEQETNQLVNDTTQALKRLTQLTGGAKRQWKLQAERLMAEFKDTLKRYNRLQKLVANTVKAHAITQAATQEQQPDLIGWGDSVNEEQRMLDQDQRRQQLQAQQVAAEADLAFMQERESRIRELEGDILDINEIFKELATLVQEQGEMINTIEDNVEGTHANVEQGSEELRKAAMYQRRARKKKCIIALILLVILTVLTLIIVLSVKGKH